MRPSTLAELADAGRDPGPRIRGFGPSPCSPPRTSPPATVLAHARGLRRLVYEVVEDGVARRRGLGRAVVLRAPPPRPVRHRRGHRRHGARRRRAAAARSGSASGSWSRPTGPSTPRSRSSRPASPRAARDHGVVVVRARQRRGDSAARALRRGVRNRQRRRLAVDAPRRRARRPGIGARRARRVRPRPAPARRPGDRGPRAGERLADSRHRASTCAPPRTCCSRSSRRSPSTRSRQLLEAGVRCSINADDPLLFGPGLLGSTSSRAPSSASTTTPSRRAQLLDRRPGAPDELKARRGWRIDAWLATA